MKIEFDEGYAFGLGVFETIKVKAKKPLSLEKHLRRLQRGLSFFAISQKVTEKEIEEYINQGEEEDFALKIMVSEKNILFVKRENPYQNYDRRRGLRLTISSVRRHTSSPLIYHKTLQYADNILEKRKATQKGYDEVLFFNEKDCVCEGAVSNLFFVRGEEIYTPKIEDGLLAGTMREKILENYRVKEISISREELPFFEACFITNALMGILWVESIDDIHFQKNVIIDRMVEELQKIE